MRMPLDLPAEFDATRDAVLGALTRVEHCFDEQLAVDLPPVMEMIAHVERYRGKMLRPTLAILAGLAASPEARAAVDAGDDPAPFITDEHVKVAAMCEMIHMATLVHDDVLDEAEVRRRGATLNRLRGNEPAVILGDYLFAAAFHLCSTLTARVPSEIIGRVSMVMCAGELLQLHHRDDKSIDEPTYFEILDRKTAALIGVAAELGARSSCDDPAVWEAMRVYGAKLGIAFQIQDDLLDLTGTEETVGKSVGKDIEKGKLTLPLIHHLAMSNPRERGRSLELVERAAGPGHREDAAELRAALEATGSVDHARVVARRLTDEAMATLDVLPESRLRQLLEHLAGALIARAY